VPSAVGSSGVLRQRAAQELRHRLHGELQGALPSLERGNPNTVTAQMNRAHRVEQCYGDLDEHYRKDQLKGLITELRYTAEDARRNRPNETKIPFEGNIGNNLASYRNAVERYRRFLETAGEQGLEAALSPRTEPESLSQDDLGRQFGLERDMQAALRAEIEQLEGGLEIIDDGAERSVESGFIDITARDRSGAIVVIELKRGTAGQRAVAQILSYMGDVAAEEEGRQVRGILVAGNFDSKAKSASRMVPNLVLRLYSVQFTFSDGHS
jgi:endonuclease